MSICLKNNAYKYRIHVRYLKVDDYITPLGFAELMFVRICSQYVMIDNFMVNVY